MKLLEVVPINGDGNTERPVSCVCYHPIAEKRLRNGEKAEPMYCAVEIDEEIPSILSMLTNACGWQGGTIHQVIEEIKRLKNIELSYPTPKERSERWSLKKSNYIISTKYQKQLMA